MTVAPRIDALHGVPGDGCDRILGHYAVIATHLSHGIWRSALSKDEGRVGHFTQSLMDRFTGDQATQDLENLFGLPDFAEA
jgi:hypothetical protein